MKTIIKQSKKPSGKMLLMAVLFLLFNSCGLEDPADPFTGTDGCLELSTNRFVTISIDEDSVLWSWGKSANNQPGKWSNEDNIQPIRIGSN